jgi:hypothetical protein
MPYNDAILNEADRQKISALGEQWKSYTAAGNTAAAQAAHDQAEAIRGKYGYSGGASGSEYVPTGTNTVIRQATDQSEKLNGIYDANLAARQQALESAWNQKNMDYDRAEQKIAPTYDAQRNDLETQFQIARHNMGERAAANGINSGTGTQIALSQQNEYLRDYGALNKQEAAARSDLEFERAKASAAYRDAVAQALADNDVERAKALYDEAVRVDNSLVSTSQSQIAIDLQREATEYARMKDQADNLAKFGDFSGYKALGYTDAEIAQMRAVWAAENPLLAAAVGMGGYGYAGGSYGVGSRRGNRTPETPTEENGDGNTAKKSGSSGSVNGIGGAIGRAVGGGIGAILSGEGPSGNRSGASAKSGNSSKWWRDPKTGALYYIDN